MLIAALSDARKLFRVAKFLVEYQKINILLGKADTMAIHKLILALIPRVAFFFYWIFDTLIVLTKIKFLTNTDLKWLTHKWAAFWQLANLTGILSAIIELVEIGKEEVKLIAQKRVANSSNGGQIDSASGEKKTTLDEIKQQQRALNGRKFTQVLNIIKNAGDTITSTSLLGWDEHYLNYKFNEGLIGVGGFVSGVLSCYNLYPAPKK